MHIKKHLAFTPMRKILSDILTQWDDPRDVSRTKISLHDVVMSAFACMFYQDSSLLQFQRRLQESTHSSNLHTQFGIQQIPSDTQLREILDQLPSHLFEAFFKSLMTQLQRSKCLERYESPLGGYLCSLDGTGYYASEKVKCKHCLLFKKRTGDLYAHRAMQAVLLSPDEPVVFPFMPVDIANRQEEAIRQDCELNAGHRMLDQLKSSHPRLKLTILGDALYACRPFMKHCQEQGYHYILTSKATDNKYLHEEMDLVTTKKEGFVERLKGRECHYEYVNGIRFTSTGNETVNLLRYRETTLNAEGKPKVLYSSAWITDHEITDETAAEIARSGRARWKIENECFNTLKNKGYHVEHNFGHGEQYLGFNFYTLMVLAFFVHQVLEMNDKLFQSCRKKFGSKVNLWNHLRTSIQLIIFETFEQMLEYILNPPEIHAKEFMGPG